MFEITLFRFIFDTFCVYRFLLRLYSSRIDRTQFLIFFGSRTIRVFCFETQQISFLANWIGSSTNDDSQLLRKVRTLYLWKLYLRRMFIVRKEIRLHFITCERICGTMVLNDYILNYNRKELLLWIWSKNFMQVELINYLFIFFLNIFNLSI